MSESETISATPTATGPAGREPHQVPAEPAGADERTSSGRHLLQSSGIVAVGTLLSRITGLGRTVMILIALGAGPVADAYNLANSTPNMIYDLLLGGVLSATLVPILVSNRERRDDAGTNAVMTVSAVALVAITLMAALAAPAIIGLYGTIGKAGGSGPNPAQEELAVFWLRLFAPQVLFYGLTSLATALLNTHRRFAAAAFAPVLNNLMMIAVLIAAKQVIGEGLTVDQVRNNTGLVLLLGIGTTAGIAAMALVLWPAVQRAHLRVRWHFDLHDPAVRQVARLSGWTVGYVIANQVTLFVIMSLAFGAQAGAVSAWNYAYQFFQLPYGVFTVSVMTAFTPELASLAERGQQRDFNQRFLQGFRVVCLVLLPATVLFIALALPVMSILVRGNFSSSDANLTASVVAALAWGMVGFSLYLYVLRGFYALKDTRTPFVINLFENALTLLAAFVLVRSFGVEGLAWSWSIAYMISAAVAFVVLRRRIGPFGLRAAVATTAPLARMVLATVVMAIVVSIVTALLPKTGTGAWATLFVGGVGGLGVYAGVLFALRVSEIRELPRLLLRR